MKTTALFTPLLLSSLKPKAKEYVLHDAQCDGLALRILPGGTKSWICWQRLSGKTKRITLGALDCMDPAAARDAFHIFMGTGKVDAASTDPRSLLTFGDLCRLFIEEKQHTYRPSSLSTLGYYLNSQLLPAFGAKRLTGITTPDVANWFYGYSRTRPGGANQVLGHFRTILNWGVKARHIPDGFVNPSKPVPLNRRQPIGQMLNADQLTSLSSVLLNPPQTRQDAANAIWLILLTGCRSGEILRLRWDEVEPDRLCLHRTKTGPREVMLSDAAIKHLQKLRTARNGRSDYIFPSKRAAKPYRTSIDSTWCTIKRHAGLPPSLRLHDLRHTYASHAIMAGVSLSMTGQLLGHRSIGSTDRYAHLDDGHLLKAAEKVASKVEMLMR